MLAAAGLSLAAAASRPAGSGPASRRRRRNQAEYPNPTNYEPITVAEAKVAEAKEAIDAANGYVSSADRLLQPDELGIF